MKECSAAELPHLLEFLRNDIPNCFYMYVDIAKYGLDNPNMRVWIELENDSIIFAVMKYYNSMQVYSPVDVNMEQVAALVVQEDVPIVTGNEPVASKLAELLEDRFELTPGFIFELEKFKLFPSPTPIECASEDELEECAKLICMDEGIGGYYSHASLAQQLKDRQKEGMGRNYVIRQDDQIIAHIATYAEFENFAVTSGLIVHPDHRHIPYGTYLESKLVNDLLSEEKRVFSFLQSKKRIKYYKATAVAKQWNNGKLVRKTK